MSGSIEYWPTKKVRYGAPTRAEKLRRFIIETPSAILLIAQLLAIFTYPFLEQATKTSYQTLGRAAFGAISVLVLFIAVRAVRATPAINIVAFVVGAPAVVLLVMEAFLPDNQVVSFWSHALAAVFYMYTGYGLVRYMFADNWVTRDELWATGATFTVLAFGFAHLFYATQFIWPDSYTIYGQADPGFRSWYELLYMSVTSMTGLGMSDIIGVEPHARAFVMMSQMTGMLYVALVVARLVGLTIARFRA